MTRPANERETCARSTFSKIDRKKCAPMPARITFGDQANTDSRDRKTWRVPAATAVLRIDPRFPGSWMFSSSTQPERGFGTGPASGVRMTAATPSGLASCEIAAKRPSGSSRRERAGKFSRNARVAGSANALSVPSTVSAVPPLSWYAFARRLPSRSVLPVLRRSRDEPASLTRALNAGLLLERIAFTSNRAGAEPGKDVAPVRGIEIPPAVGDESHRSREASAAQDLVRPEPWLGIFAIRIAHETRVGPEGAGGPLPDVADHLAAPAQAVPGGEPAHRDPAGPAQVGARPVGRVSPGIPAPAAFARERGGDLPL